MNMNNDAIHNPSADTNEQTEATMKEIVNQPKVTESHAETTPPGEATLLDAIESPGEDAGAGAGTVADADASSSVGEIAGAGAHESAADPLPANQLGDQPHETHR